MEYKAPMCCILSNAISAIANNINIQTYQFDLGASIVFESLAGTFWWPRTLIEDFNH